MKNILLLGSTSLVTTVFTELVNPTHWAVLGYIHKYALRAEWSYRRYRKGSSSRVSFPIVYPH